MLATVMDRGIDLSCRPFAKKTGYSLVKPQRRALIDNVGNAIYNISKFSVMPFRVLGKISPLMDAAVYYGLTTATKCAVFTGSYLKKGISHVYRYFTT